jgi:predicted Zn finger-like uncharacterized protein
MDIRCPSCSKLFRVADEKISGKGIRFKCSKCAEVITITKDDFEMDLLAREGEAEEQALQQPQRAPVPQPQAAPEPSITPAPPQPIPSPEPEAREYQPPSQEPEQDLPPAALDDFDFSEPHAAAAAAAHPEEGFGGRDFSFGAEPEEGSVPELEISLEAAAEAEAALQFPDDLISEPKRMPVFGAPSAGEPTADEEPEQKPAQRPTGPGTMSSGSQPPLDMGAEEETGLGTALAMQKEPTAGPGPAAAGQGSELGSEPVTPKGPVITPDLLAEMMKRSTSGKSAAKAKPTAPAEGDIDLGAALSIPKATETAGREEDETGPKTAAATRALKEPLLGKRALVIAAVALVLVAVLAGLYYLGFLWGKNEQEALQKQQPISQSKSQPARQEITPEGLSIVDPVAFVDPERGDLVITGMIQNTTDQPKPGWYLVTEVRDSKETVLATVQMVNGIQIYSKAEQETFVKRGGKIDGLQRKMASPGEGTIPPKGSVSFEVRVMNPPAGSARFLPMLQSVDPSTLIENMKAAQGHP